MEYFESLEFVDCVLVKCNAMEPIDTRKLDAMKPRHNRHTTF